jgi:threonine/homoserine/homoserine lactone efflux protein
VWLSARVGASRRGGGTPAASIRRGPGGQRRAGTVACAAGESFVLRHLLPFILFTLVGSFTPGPNNTIAMLTGVHHGFRAAVPHVFGVCTGFALITVTGWAGVGALLLALPGLAVALRLGGAAYLLWLAWQLARGPGAAPPHAPAFRALTFGRSTLLQFGNPKAWAFAVATLTTFSTGALAQLGVLIALWTVAIAASVATWAAAGQVLAGFLAPPARARGFNLAMGALLAATAVAGVVAQPP